MNMFRLDSITLFSFMKIFRRVLCFYYYIFIAYFMRIVVLYGVLRVLCAILHLGVPFDCDSQPLFVRTVEASLTTAQPTNNRLDNSLLFNGTILGF